MMVYGKWGSVALCVECNERVTSRDIYDGWPPICPHCGQHKAEYVLEHRVLVRRARYLRTWVFFGLIPRNKFHSWEYK